MFVKTKYLALLGISATLSACGGGSTAPTSMEALNAPAPVQSAEFRTTSFKHQSGRSSNLLETKDWSFNAESNSLKSGSQSIDYSELGDQATIALIYPSVQDGSDTYTSVSYVGKPSDISDIPQHIGADFKGSAQGIMSLTASVSLSEYIGSSNLALSGTSAAITADLTLSNLKSKPDQTQTELGFDTISVTNMTLEGTTLTGDALVVTQDGQSVELLGGNTNNEALAQFYGDGAELIAGHVVSTSELGLLQASFESELQQ